MLSLLSRRYVRKSVNFPRVGSYAYLSNFASILSSQDHLPTFSVTTAGKWNDFREYLREILAQMKTIPWCESRAYGVPVPIYEEEKTEFENLVLQSL